MENRQLIEQVVPKARTPKHSLIVLGILSAVVIIPVVIVLIAILSGIHYLVILALFAFLFCIYGAWFFITSLNVEFEYAFLSSVMRVDKIIAKRRRKKMVKLDVKRIDDFFPYSDEEMSRRRFNKVYHVSHKEYAAENYVFTFKDEAKGKCAVIFTPSEEFLAAMKPYCSFEVKKKFNEYHV